jgi:hypothetical protein
VKISNAFPSKYLRAADIEEMGGRLTHTVRKVVMEEVGQDRQEKPVVYFTKIRPGLVLNRTNAARLAASLGDETDGWAGKTITLETEKVPMRGQLVDSIKAYVDGKFMEERRPPTSAEVLRSQVKPLGQDADQLDDEIPF